MQSNATVMVQLEQVPAGICGNYKSISPKVNNGLSLGPVHAVVGKNTNTILTMSDQRLSHVSFPLLDMKTCQPDVFSLATHTCRATWVDSLGFGEVHECRWQIWLILISILQGIIFHPCVSLWYSRLTLSSSSVSPLPPTLMFNAGASNINMRQSSRPLSPCSNWKAVSMPSFSMAKGVAGEREAV